MFSSRAKPRSIASQLILLFTPAAGLLLLIGLGALYWIVIRHAFEEDNAVLADKLAALRADLHESANPRALADELRAARSKPAYWIRILDESGAAVAETPGMDALVPPGAFPPVAATNHRPRDLRTSGRLFSLAATAGDAAGRRYTIQVAQDRSGDDQFRREFGLVTIAMLGCGIAASALIARTVARRGLRPLAEMAATVEGISPARLTERISSRRWPPELQPLASAFDAMLERLEESFTRLSRFSADLAHELRTPIANMLGEAQVTLSRSRTADEYRDVIESTVAECERLSGIVDSLLFLARADAASEQVHRQRFDGRAELEKIASYYWTAADDRQISIRCDGSADINADPTLFRRAVGNLLDNALRYTPDGGEIVIALRADADAATLEVHDTGPGIAAEHVPRVFDRFYRVDSSRSTAGSGLGLALVKSIAELHGGSVALQGNGGTMVRLRFPNHPR